MIGQEVFLELINQFLEQQINAEPFCLRFTKLWMRHRDAIYAKKLTWSKPHDEELMAAFQRGEITAEQFTKQWRRLWGTEGTEHFQHMIDVVHSACDVFRPIPALSGEINEDELRQEVTRELTSYTLKTTLL